MAEDMPGAGAAVGGTTVVIPGEMAARVDRLPMSRMAWELALLVQVGWACSASVAGTAARLYPFIWLPRHVMDSFEYSVLYALGTGISVLIGGYAIGWLADRIGRRKALILSSVLAGVFTWPFGYVTDYPALVVLSLADTLGFAGYLAVNVVYMSEMMGPTVRSKVIRSAQVLAIFLLSVVLSSLIPHYWIPGEYRRYLWLLAALNIVVALALSWRMPESPRWLEARERRDQARTIVERMEARVMKRHPVLPEPDLTPHQVVAEEKTSWLAPFGRQHVVVTVFLLVVMVLGYGHVYGYAGYRFLFLAESRHYSAGFIFALAAWAAAASAAIYLLNALLGERVEPKYTQHHPMYIPMSG
jgi:MFS family permease